MSEDAKWYVIHTYSGYENAVKTSIEKFVTGRNMEDMILQMEIPVETVKEVTESGETKEVERKVFPGYVLIKMVMTDDTWHLVRNVRGVTGFVGSANKPIPLTEDEVLAMGMEKHEVVVQLSRGRPCEESWTVLWPALPAWWRKSSPKRIKSASWFPCSVGRLPWSSSWIRWKRRETDCSRRRVRQNRGRGRWPRQRADIMSATTFMI